ncbi:CRISPR-associated primase-polymerase type A1 [Lottiidibacillus patelloidae]|uniref:CRISPR-associated primase-polymerase type A1 n=1 Tax=Lottiidibacillus patelloidae TaxID=2670334 RepID=UPI0013039F91|nr:CRISPR-associated primase-polymerase type A1 [Lottiidibacillus patelloidae]
MQPLTIFSEKYLWEAWEKAKKGSDAAGIDGKRFSSIKDEEDFVKGVYEKILVGTYEPSPVKELSITKANGKERNIGILTVEDRLVHMIVKCWLEPQCKELHHPQSYAYQQGKSSAQALEQLEKWIYDDGYDWIGETDIADFFDTIDHSILRKVLETFIKEKEKIDFVMYLFSKQQKGVVQGSPLSPLLANIYLYTFDEYLTSSGKPYIRFADDIIIADHSKDEVKLRLAKMQEALQALKLNCNLDKTAVKHITEQFTFLGFTFTQTGRVVSEKGTKSLIMKLNEISKDNKSLIEERIVKYKQILNGWKQYFSIIPWQEIANYEVLLLSRDFTTDKQIIENCYLKITNNLYGKPIERWHCETLFSLSLQLDKTKDSFYWLALIFNKNLSLTEEMKGWLKYNYTVKESLLEDLLERLNSLYFHKEDSKNEEFVDWLIENRMFAIAKLLHDPNPGFDICNDNSEEKKTVVSLDKNNAFTEFYHLFNGKEGSFYVEVLEEGKRVSKPIHRPWTVEDVEKHFCGEITIVQPMVRSNKTVTYALIDIDIQSYQLQKIKGNEEEFQSLLRKAFKDMSKIYTKAKENSLPSLLVESGNRGYHVWFFFDEPVPLPEAYDFLNKLIEDLTPTEGIVWERFPHQRKLKPDKVGQKIKLPWGRHSVTKKQGYFIDEEGHILQDQLSPIESVKKISRKQLREFINGSSNLVERLNEDAYLIPHSIQLIIAGCPIIQHFINKAKTTNYLNHQERLLILNVFGPLGSEGKKYIHQVIGHTMNYDEAITNKFIKRSYSKPISCHRIREHYPKVTANLPCNCKFPISKGQYPSPVLHNKKNTSLVTPKSQLVPKQTPTKPTTSTNTNVRVNQKEINDLANKLIELRKHKRGLSKRLSHIEEELTRIFDEKKVDKVEIDIGFLVRKQKENENNWVIHI